MIDKQNTAALHASLDLRGVLEAVDNADFGAICGMRKAMSESIDELEEAFDLE